MGLGHIVELVLIVLDLSKSSSKNWKRILPHAWIFLLNEVRHWAAFVINFDRKQIYKCQPKMTKLERDDTP